MPRRSAWPPRGSRRRCAGRARTRVGPDDRLTRPEPSAGRARAKALVAYGAMLAAAALVFLFIRSRGEALAPSAPAAARPFGGDGAGSSPGDALAHLLLALGA